MLHLTYNPSPKNLERHFFWGHAQYSPLAPVKCCEKVQFGKASTIFNFVKGEVGEMD